MIASENNLTTPSPTKCGENRDPRISRLFENSGNLNISASNAQERLEKRHIQKGISMKKHFIALTAIGMACGIAHAVENRRAPENRQAYCEIEMKGVKDENVRKAQILDCMKQSEASHEKKVKMCEASARGRAPEDRNAYISDCLNK